jgi:hypothetical protein
MTTGGILIDTSGFSCRGCGVSSLDSQYPASDVAKPVIQASAETAAWIVRDEFVFKATLVGFGCFTIVVGAVACLLALVKRVDRG